MENEILFEEEQKFKQWWLWTLILVVNGFLIYNLFNNVILKDKDVTFSIITLIIGLSISIFFYNIKLKTKIFKDRIEILLLPFRIHKTFIFKNMKKIEVVKYNPILEYGGWGIRLGAYTISGNKGIKMYYDKDVILIGTQKSEELTKTIKHLKND